MRFTLGTEQVYEAASVDRLTLKHWLKVEKETASLGRPMKWGEIRAMLVRVSQLPPAELEADDDFVWFIALIVWAARYDAGEDISLLEAVDVSLGDIVFLPDEGEAAAQESGDLPQVPRPGSGRGDDSEATSSSTASPSGSPSSDA